MNDVREILQKAQSGMASLAKEQGDAIRAFGGFDSAVCAKGAIDAKTKELICVAVAVHARCEYCIVIHVYQAYQAGATRDEILEAALVATALGGGPAMVYTATLLQDAVNEFEQDFKK
jgi:AhpD family alkylhydroperoxidase